MSEQQQVGSNRLEQQLQFGSVKLRLGLDLQDSTAVV